MKVMEARLREEVKICEQQYGFMPRNVCLENADGEVRASQGFVDLEKAYNKKLREELLSCMRDSGVAEEYFRLV